MLPDADSREWQKQSMAVEVLRTAGSVRLAVRGYSMLPTLWPGDVLTIEATSFDRVLPGDVILFAREGRFFIHRILRKECSSFKPHLLTRGDAMPEPDAAVVPDELLGRIVCAEHAGRPFAVPACSLQRRSIGLLFAHASRVRSMALRWRAWQNRKQASLSSEELPVA